MGCNPRRKACAICPRHWPRRHAHHLGRAYLPDGAALKVLGLKELWCERILDRPVPAAFWQRAIMKASDIETIPRASHRDVKKPFQLTLPGGFDGLLCVGDRLQTACAFDSPNRYLRRTALIV